MRLARTPAFDAAFQVVRTLRDAGFVAYFAGGCVRDMLLGLEPADFDVATDAPPEKVREQFRNTQAVGQAFGVILVRLNRCMIEVATFRTDGEYADGRHPAAVTFSDAEHDARRRDFTINGLFFDPIGNRVIDFVQGQHDLAHRTLRAIGDPQARFAEDHLRMLRAVRFAARFDLAIDPATADAIRRDAHLLPRISGERIADELRRTLTPPTRRRAFVDLWSLALIGHATGMSISADISLQTDHSILLALDADQEASFSLVLLASLIDVRWHAGGAKHDILGNLSPADTGKIVAQARTHLKLSNDESDAMLAIARLSHPLLSTRDWPVAMSKRSLAHPASHDMRQLLKAIARTGVASDRIEAIQTHLDQFAHVDCAPVPLLTGDHLVAAGYLPGPSFKRVLDAVYDAQLESRITTPAAALDLAKSLLL
jgi:poly(A) polymerase